MQNRPKLSHYLSLLLLLVLSLALFHDLYPVDFSTADQHQPDSGTPQTQAHDHRDEEHGECSCILHSFESTTVSDWTQITQHNSSTPNWISAEHALDSIDPTAIDHPPEG